MNSSAPGVTDTRTTLFLVDAQLTVREALRALANAEPDFFVVGACATASKRTSYQGVPGVIVADVDLPDAQGPRPCACSA